MDFLTTHNLTIGYKHKGTASPVLCNLNLNLSRGSLVSLLGANGAGKSTLLRTITASQLPLSGEIFLDGRNIASISHSERSKLIGIVTTDQIHAGALTVRELVSLGRHPHTGFLGRLSKHDYDVVDQAMADAGIAHKAESFVAQLSDGERQKAMIAKSLAQTTPLIILDEPTAFLDVASRIETMQLLHNLAHKHNKAILLSSHDISQSLLLADYLWLIDSERNLITGCPEDLIISGKMNQMFKSQNINFNKELGDFEMTLHTSHSASLCCTDISLHRCITNALRRNGIAITSDSKLKIIATDAGIEVDCKKVTNIENLIVEVKTKFGI